MTTLRRQVKNVIKNYTEAEVKVREATSNDPWGPSSTLMSEISDLTYNIVALGDIMRMIWKRLNDHGKNWRHVYKSLVLLDYLIKNGNEKVAQQCKEHIVAVQTLKDFQYIEENKDQGANVRDKAKQLVSLLRDDERLKQERIKALKARERYAQNAMGISSDNKITYSTAGTRMHTGSSTKSGGNYSDPYGGARSDAAEFGGGNGRTSQNSIPLSPDMEAVRPSDQTEEELQMNLALALSKQEHEEEQQRKRADDAKLQIALEQSKMDNSTESHDNGLLDLAAGFSSNAPAAAASSDPWGDNFISANSTDPWSNSSAPMQTLYKNSHVVDPWNGAATANGGGSNVLSQLNDPWASSAPLTSTTNKVTTTNPWNDSNKLATASNDPWGGDVHSNGNHMDEFEQFSNKRSLTSPTTTSSNVNNDPFGDFFGGATTAVAKPSTNPWENGGSASHNTEAKINPTRKTPESFLGENSSLVNLDNLIPTTKNTMSQRPNSTNPFGAASAQLSALQPSTSSGNLLSSTKMSTASAAAPTVNPFMQQAQKPPSINQLNGNSANLFPSFSTTATSAPFSQSPVFMQMNSTNNNNNNMMYPAFNQQTTAATSFHQQQQSTNPFL